MARATYSEKLRDPRWQRKRLEIMQRDNFTCQGCGDKTSTLAVHHRWYERGHEPWDHPDEALVTLCETCHETEREYRAETEGALLEALHRCGFMAEEVRELAIGFYKLSLSKPYRSSVVASTLNWLFGDRDEEVGRTAFEHLIGAFRQWSNRNVSDPGKVT